MLSRSIRFVRIAMVAILALSAYAAAAQTAVRSIHIQTGWGGLGPPRHFAMTIRNENGVYRYNGTRVDPALVMALLRALQSPAIESPQLSNLGVTTVWLNSRLSAAEKSLPAPMSDALPSQLRLFEKSFRNPHIMARPVANQFRYVSMDDNPYSSVEVVLAGGTKISATTHSYYPFMIPWTVGKGTKTYNADLSRAVSRLLPPKTTDKQRLAGEGLVAGLAQSLMYQIQNEWNMLGAEGRAGNALSILRRHYTVLRADINPYQSVYYGRKWTASGPHETNLHVVLHKADFPANLNENLVLKFSKGKVIGLEGFLANGDHYEKLVLSVPWLKTWLATHPNQKMTLMFVHDASLGKHAMRSFAADMKARGREDLIPQVSAQRKEIALLHIGFVFWLLFPDHHMMVWRFDGPRGFLKWTASDFPAGECDSYYAENNGGCSGREVSSDGDLLPEAPPRDRTCMAAWRKTHPVPHTLPDALFSITEDGREGMIDARGNVIIPPCFDVVDDFSDGLARFERDNLWGYVNAAGEVVISPTFPWAETFHEGLAWVQMKGHALDADARWGVIDRVGRVVTQATYMRLFSDEGGPEAFHEGLAVVQVAGKAGFPSSGYINRTGKTVIPPRFTMAFPFSDGLAAATESGFGGTQKWGFIDKTGKWVIPPLFAWADDFAQGLAAVSLHGKCGYINRSGTIVIQPPTPAGEKDCTSAYGDFAEGLSRWRFGDKWGYINMQGRTVISPVYDMAFGFSEGLAAVRVGNEWGYINTKGVMVISPRKLGHAGTFHHGLARFTTSNGFGYIDRTGKTVWSGKNN